VTTPRTRDYGDQALLLECDSTAEVLAWTQALREAELPDVLDIVPAARTVLVALAGPQSVTPTRQRLDRMDLGDENIEHRPHDGQADIVIDVVYDGADLAEVAQLTGLDTATVIAAHTEIPWRVGFGGFAPGFAYLVDGDPRLEVPRRAEPRTKVPAGAVGLAGQFSGVYPRESPGGWQLIGHTDAVLWDIDRAGPALLVPGMWVQFRAV
jgi:KipI family sensor histidine kinase inhibitor